MSDWQDEPDEFLVMNWEGDGAPPAVGETMSLPDALFGFINVFVVQATRPHPTIAGQQQLRLVHQPEADPTTSTWRDPFTRDDALDLLTAGLAVPDTIEELDP